MNSDVKKHFDAPRKVALYMYIGGCLEGTVTVSEVEYTRYDEHWNLLPDGETREQTRDSRMRISEPVEVSFAATDNEKMVANAVAALDEAERELLREMNRKITELRNRKAQFLALTHQAEEA